MNNTKTALEKFLNVMVVKDIPEIEEFMVDDISFDESPFKDYRVYIGIAYDDFSKVDSEEIKEKIIQFSSYILNRKNEKLRGVVFFDPRI